MRILYVVSTLQSCGPTNQLYNIIKHLDSKLFDAHIITLSPEPSKSRWNDFKKLNVSLSSLNLSRLKGVFVAKRRLGDLINEMAPDIVHSQGIRGDALVSSLSLKIPHVITVRNYPHDDYPSKFGNFKGKLMALKHLRIMRSGSHLIACSKTIRDKLNRINIKSEAIQNGVEVMPGRADRADLPEGLSRPIFISVGSLIPRKNMKFLIEAFNRISNRDRGSLIILGDGPLRPILEEVAGDSIFLVGDVHNVSDYLTASDYFVSTSLSEGLPNTVLEALACGLPVIISDIDSHREIFHEKGGQSCLIRIDDGGCSLTAALQKPEQQFRQIPSPSDDSPLCDIFSAKKMSFEYQSLYSRIQK